MSNIGEEITGFYLEAIKGCSFVQYNLYTHKGQSGGPQGEIDVVGINLEKNIIYVCEVAIHLTTGLFYVNPTTKRPDPERIFRKFDKDIEYAKHKFPDYERVYMLWSPIVKSSRPSAKHDQLKSLLEVQSQIKLKHDVELDLIINQRYKDCLEELKQYTTRRTEEIKSTVGRLFQLEAYLDKYLASQNNDPS